LKDGECDFKWQMSESHLTCANDGRVSVRFLENALSNSGVTDDQQRSLYRELCSDEQLRSAFEIADTDGDGLTTYDEAVEVCSLL
jgi:hypothetical protein